MKKLNAVSRSPNVTPPVQKPKKHPPPCATYILAPKSWYTVQSLNGERCPTNSFHSTMTETVVVQLERGGRIFRRICVKKWPKTFKEDPNTHPDSATYNPTDESDTPMAKRSSSISFQQSLPPDHMDYCDNCVHRSDTNYSAPSAFATNTSTPDALTDSMSSKKKSSGQEPYHETAQQST